MSTTVQENVSADSEPAPDPANSLTHHPCVVSSNVYLSGGVSDNLTLRLSGEYTGPTESVLPREFRQQLHKHFARIEREFEREYRRLYGENLALQERLDKFEDGDHSESTTLAKKLGASMISQRIKQQYKQSTSRIVSSLRQSAGHSTSGLPNSSSVQSPGNNPSVIGGTNPTSSNTVSIVAHPINTSAAPMSTSSLNPNTQGSAVFAGNFAGHSGSWQLLHRLTGHRDGIWEVTTHGQFVATASADNTVRLWTNDTQMNCLMLYLGHYGSVNSVRFRERDRLLLTSSGDGTAQLVRLPYDLLVKTANILAINSPGNANATVSAMEAASTALSAAVAGSGKMGLNSVGAGKSGGSEVTWLEGDDSVLGSVEHDVPEDGSPNRANTAISSVGPISVRHPHAIFQSANLSLGSYTDSSPLSAADFLTGREQLVTAGWDRVGRIYDLLTGVELDSLTGHDGQLTDVRCAPGGSPVVVTSSRDCSFRLWDFRQPGMRVHIQQAHNQSVSTTQFLAGGPPERLISAGADRFCRLWDLRQSRGPVVSIRTDAGVNRLSISGSNNLPVVSLITKDSSSDSNTIIPSIPNPAGESSLPTMPQSNPSLLTGGGMQNGGGLLPASTTASGPTASVGAHPNPTVTNSTWATSFTKVLAVPLDNRGIRFFDLSGNRIGRLTRSSARGHSRMVTSVAWADEGLCNFFSAGFDCRLLAWQIQLNNV